MGRALRRWLNAFGSADSRTTNYSNHTNEGEVIPFSILAIRGFSLYAANNVDLSTSQQAGQIPPPPANSSLIGSTNWETAASEREYAFIDSNGGE